MKSRPYGSWSSPITSERIVAGSLRLSQPRFDRGDLYWLEGRPQEGGRQVVMRARGCSEPVDEVSPAGVNVRTRVHEYGGGDYAVHDGVLYFCAFDDQRVRALHLRDGASKPLCEPGSCFADLEVSPDGAWLVCVEERPREGEPENRLIAWPLRGGPAQIVAAGRDFVSFPRFAPDGRTLAFTAWMHPDMPWDATQLYTLPWGADGPVGAPRCVAGNGSESIFQPGFSPAGVLTYVSDRGGWWNLYRADAAGSVALCPREEEFGLPQWVFGMSTYGFASADTILCIHSSGARDRLARLDLASGRLDDVALPYESLSGLRVDAAAGCACFIGAAPARPAAVCVLDLATGAVRELRRSLDDDVDAAFVSVPEAIEVPTTDAEIAHAFHYRPRHPRYLGPAGSHPPLLVKSHGGPTSATGSAYDPRIQYWTSRGFAVLDVNYRGSTGYGRAYRDRLRGEWGIVDVEDCVNAARFAAEQGWADAERLAISGGSAGGFTTLCALTFHDAFGAGASHYGIGDLEALARDTHKFESRYLDGLVGPYPERRDLYAARSPIHFTDRLARPVIFFQGLDDRVVPPNQAEAMVAALARRGIPHAYVPFAGEQHGFRRAENQRTALDGELYFYSQVFGFEVEVRPAAVRIVRGSEPAAR